MDHYTRIGFGAAVDEMPTVGKVSVTNRKFNKRPMVTIAVAKRKGSDAVHVAEAVSATAEKIARHVESRKILLITRDYGGTAITKSTNWLST